VDALDSPKSALEPVVPGTGLPSSWSDAPDLFYQEAELLAYLRSRFEVTERTAFGHSHTPTVTVAARAQASANSPTRWVSEQRENWSSTGPPAFWVRLVEADYLIRARAGQGKGPAEDRFIAWAGLIDSRSDR